MVVIYIYLPGNKYAATPCWPNFEHPDLNCSYLSSDPTSFRAHCQFYYSTKHLLLRFVQSCLLVDLKMRSEETLSDAGSQGLYLVLGPNSIKFCRLLSIF